MFEPEVLLYLNILFKLISSLVHGGFPPFSYVGDNYLFIYLYYFKRVTLLATIARLLRGPL